LSFTTPQRRVIDSLLAWYFVSVWGSGYLATKIGIQYAAPFTFLALRFALGLCLLIPLVLVLQPAWPSRAEFGHVLVAGLLVHAVNLGGSHYAQYLGMSAGIAALILGLQPVITAFFAAHWMKQPLTRPQWAGVALGLTGVALVVWHKIDVRAISEGSLIAIAVALAAMTAGTLYQRRFCPTTDLYSAALLQFAISLVVLAPLAFVVEGAQVTWSWQLFASIVFLVVFASILAVNALHTLMRHGEATRVTSLIYLTPLIAVLLEFLIFDVVPSLLTMVGIVVTCTGVALVAWHRKRV
jgi:drug/metabolite transporter (DMT)-like permease